MAAQLLRWANSLGLKNKVENLDVDLADGCVVAELLAIINVLKPPILRSIRRTERGDVENAAQNYEKIIGVLKNELGMDVNRKDVAQVILEQPGAAATFLFRIKCKLEPETAACEDSRLSLEEKNRREKEAAVLKAKATIKHKPIPNHDLELGVRGLLTKKQLDTTLHLAHFEDRRINREKEIDMELRQEEEDLNKTRAERREAQRERLREGREFLDLWIAQGKANWKTNQLVKRDRIRRELQFELTCRAREAAQAEAIRCTNATQVQRGAEEFERNLKRLGVDTGDSASTGTEVMLMDQVDLSLPANREAVVKEMMIKDSVEVSKYMTRIKTQHEESLASRKAREQRRRKMLVDQEKAQKSVDEELAEEMLLQSMQAESREERLAAKSRRHKRHTKRVEAVARSSFIQNYLLHREKIYCEEVKAYQESLEKQSKSALEDEGSQAQLTAQAMAREERNTLKSMIREEKHRAVAKETMDLIVGLVERVIDEKSAQNDNLLHPAAWRKLKGSFITGDTVLKALDLDESIEMTLTDEEKAFGHDKFPLHEKVAEALLLDSPDPTATLETLLSDLLESTPEMLPMLAPPFHGAVLTGFSKANQKHSLLRQHFITVLSLRYGCRVVKGETYQKEAAALRTEDEAAGRDPAPAKASKKQSTIAEEDRNDLLRRVGQASHLEDMEGLSKALTKIAIFDLLQSKASGVLLVDIAERAEELQTLENTLGPMYLESNEVEGEVKGQKSTESSNPDDRAAFLQLVIAPGSEKSSSAGSDVLSEDLTQPEEMMDGFSESDPEVLMRNEWLSSKNIPLCNTVDDLMRVIVPPSIQTWPLGSQMFLAHYIAECANLPHGIINLGEVRHLLSNYKVSQSDFEDKAKVFMHRALEGNPKTTQASHMLLANAVDLLKGRIPFTNEKRTFIDEQTRFLKECMYGPVDRRPPFDELANIMWEEALYHTRRTRGYQSELWQEHLEQPLPVKEWGAAVCKDYVPIVEQILNNVQNLRAFVNRIHELIALDNTDIVGVLEVNDQDISEVAEKTEKVLTELESFDPNLCNILRQAVRTLDMRELKNPDPLPANVLLTQISNQSRKRLLHLGESAVVNFKFIAKEWAALLSTWDETCKAHLAGQDKQTRSFRHRLAKIALNEGQTVDLISLWFDV